MQQLPLIASAPPSQAKSPTRRLGLVLDTETTGSSRLDEVLEVGLVQFAFNPQSGEILEVTGEYSGLRQPSCVIHPVAFRVHGISQDMVRGKSLDEMAIGGLFAEADALFAHNASFDRRFLSPLFPYTDLLPWYCTLRNVSWRSMGHPSGKLQELIRIYRLPVGRAHRALDDARALLELLKKKHPLTNQTFLRQVLLGAPLGGSASPSTARARSGRPLAH